MRFPRSAPIFVRGRMWISAFRPRAGLGWRHRTVAHRERDMKPFTKGLVTALLAGLLAGAVFVGTAGAAGGSGAAVATGSAGCTAVTNVEAIIDDSGSMEITDPNK